MPALPKYLNKPILQQDDKQPIVFDLLGTLLDESGVYKTFYSHISKKYFLNFEPNEFVSKFFECQRGHIFANSKKPFKEIVKLSYLKLVKGADSGDVESLLAMHRDIQLLPGIKEMLLKLQQKCRFFALTNCANDMVNLMDLPSKSPVKFENVFTSENNGVYKPNSGSYERVIEYIKLPRNEIIYSSSNEWDLNASKQFGFNSKSIEELKAML